MNTIQKFHEYAKNNPRRIPETIRLRIEQEKRFLNEYKYSEELISKIIFWIEDNCFITEGELAGQKAKLTITQKWILAGIFGFYFEDEQLIFNDIGEVIDRKKIYRRLTREVTIIVASGFGKTTFIAWLNAFLLVTSFIPDPKIYIGSNAQVQSMLCFDTTRSVLEYSRFAKFFKDRKSKGEYVHKETNGLMRAMSSRGDNYEGIIPAVIILDEIHGFKTSEYANNIKKSTKREDLLVFEISTQGTVRQGYLDAKLEVARQTLKGNIIDDRKTYYIFENESIDEVLKAHESNDIDILFKSNPNIGISQTPQSVFNKIKEMIDDVSKRPVTLTKNFNIPQNSEVAYFTSIECRSKEFNKNIMHGKNVTIGLDVAYTYHYSNDLTALTFSYEDPFTKEEYFLDFFFLPKYYLDADGTQWDMISEKTNYDKVDYEYFIERGDLIIVDDTQITETFIINFIMQVIQEYNFNVLCFGLDPNKALYIKEHFQNIMKHDKYFLLDYRSEQTKYNTPIIENYKDKRKNGIIYTNNKLTEIHISNGIAKIDNNGYILFINEPGKRKDMLIAHMAARSAKYVWGVRKVKIDDDTGEIATNNELLERGYYDIR